MKVAGLFGADVEGLVGGVEDRSAGNRKSSSS